MDIRRHERLVCLCCLWSAYRQKLRALKSLHIAWCILSSRLVVGLLCTRGQKPTPKNPRLDLLHIFYVHKSLRLAFLKRNPWLFRRKRCIATLRVRISAATVFGGSHEAEIKRTKAEIVEKSNRIRRGRTLNCFINCCSCSIRTRSIHLLTAAKERASGAVP